MFKIINCAILWPDAIMSACNRCGTILAPGSMFCHSCGLPVQMAAPFIPAVAPAGTQRALVGSTPMWQAVVGFLFIITGIFALSASSAFTSDAHIPGSSNFALIASIPILLGVVLLVMGLLGKSIFTQQVVFQTNQSASYAPQSSVKWCRSCGSELLAPARVCYKCGAAQ